MQLAEKGADQTFPVKNGVPQHDSLIATDGYTKFMTLPCFS